MVESNSGVQKDMGMCVHGNFLSHCDVCVDGSDAEVLENNKMFEIDEMQEKKLTQISRVISEKIQGVVVGIRDNLLDNKDLGIVDKYKIFIQQMKLVWSAETGQSFKPLFPVSLLFAGCDGMSVRFEPKSHNGELKRVEGESDEFVLSVGIEDILTAKTREEFDTALEEVVEVIYHEVEHVDFFGSSQEEEGVEAYLRYATHPGEVRAHAKQFAYRYALCFPKEPFDVEKMRSICRSTRDTNYFITFADPDKQQKYRQFADLARVYSVIVDLTSRFVPFVSDKK